MALNWRSLKEWLSKVDPAITDPEERRRANSLSRLLLLLIFLNFVSLIQVSFANTNNPEKGPYYFALVIACIISHAINFLISRTRHYKIAASATAFFLIFAVIITTVLSQAPQTFYAASMWLGLAGIFASLYVNARTLIAVALVSVSWIAAAPSLHGITIHMMVTTLVPNFFIYTVLIFSVMLREKDKKQMELERINLVHADKMTSLGKMSANIAHEINNPLTIIQGRAEQIYDLLEHGENPENLKPLVAHIYDTCHRITRIINSLRNLTREVAHDEPRKDVNLKAIVESTLSLCESNFTRNGVRITDNSSPDLLINCHETRISQVILNLLSNAYQAVRNTPDPWIMIDTSLTKGFVELSVTDSGNGIAKQVQEKMMDPYFTSKPPGEGTGLGLSISKTIVEQYGGSLYYDKKSRNTRFVVHLPLQRQ